VSLPGQRVARTSDKFVNTGIDIIPTMLDLAGASRPAKLTGVSLRPLAAGEPVSRWRDHLMVENNMSQAGVVGDSVPMTEGRMVRSERYKYCVYAYGTRRESLIDMEKDPGEMNDLATDPVYRSVLLEHRELLRKFADEHHDPLVAVILAGEVKPREFPKVTVTKKPRFAKKAGGAREQP
jgi:choline-sulfatase